MKAVDKKVRLLRLLEDRVAIPRIAKLLRITEVAVWKRVKRLEAQGYIKRISKKPAFFAVMVTSDVIQTLSMHGSTWKPQKHRNLIHSAHRLKFSISYKGRQPYKGATEVKPFGRYGTAKQSIYKIGDVTIVAFKRKLNVWIHRPAGKLTTNQIINAREKAYLTLLGFSREHRIGLEAELSDVLRSHHVVEHKDLNEALKPILEKHPEEIKERIGSSVCKTSHKGKIEHEGVSKELTGAMVAKNLEYLVTQFPGQFGEVASGFVEYNRNIKLHLKVLQEMSETMKDIREGLKKRT